MSQYLFGLNLDGAFVGKNHHGLRNAICGPEALLSALEASLGLPPTETPPLLRELAYRDVLDGASTADSFFARSFSCDPLATARLLLSWRDTLSEAGWNAELDHDNAPPRLQCIAALDTDFRKTGLADATHASRITAILSEIDGGSFPAVESIIVTDKPDTLPSCWRNLFGALNARYDDFSPSAALSPASTTLGAIQSRLLDQEAELTSDRETLRIVTAATPEAAAHALASQLGSLNSGSTTLISDSSERNFLNRHLRSLDLPLATAKSETAAALLELPSLLFRCRIGPLDPQAWIEFLLHSISPVPFNLRKLLANQINNLPGRGDHWGKSLETCISKAKDEAAISRLREAYESWIDAPSIPSDSLAGHTLADILSPLTQWVLKRGGAKKSDNSDDASEWMVASHAIAQLETILRSENALTQTEVDRIVAEWHKVYSATSRFPGQVGSVTVLDSPSQLLAPEDHIIWWRPTATRPMRSPWTRTEVDWLSSHGISFPDETMLALAAEKSATRAALLAGKTLTIYHVTQSAGSPAEQAGILTLLLAQGGDSLINPARDLIPTEEIPLRPLPPIRRWWDLGQPDLLPIRETESFSSLSKAIDFPVDWVLDYKAKLSLGPIASYRVTDNALRSGSLLHATAELVFDNPVITWKTTNEASFHQFLDEAFPELLASHAAHYLTPGNEAAKSRLLNTARQSLWHLIQILHDSEVTEVTLEQKIDPVPFIGGQIGGRIDLIARRADGRSAVIDLKLGGKTKRTDELKSNRHLQLATYGHLMLQSEGTESATAYFILSNGGHLLTRNNSFFIKAYPISPKRDTPSSDWQDCWQEFEETYQWRRSQLDQGRIEVPVKGTEADDPPPIDRWAPPKDGNPYSSYQNLTGFPSNA